MNDGPMPIRSMTGFAQVRGDVARPHAVGGAATHSPDGRLSFSLSLKSVNHRFLDLHFRLPSGTDALEMQLRRLLKDKISRGHIEVTLSLERATSDTFSLNREIVSGYIAAFRAAAAEFSLCVRPRSQRGAAYSGRTRLGQRFSAMERLRPR